MSSEFLLININEPPRSLATRDRYSGDARNCVLYRVGKQVYTSPSLFNAVTLTTNTSYVTVYSNRSCS